MEEDYKEKYKSLKKMFKTLEQVTFTQENSKLLSQLEKSSVAIKALQSQKNLLSDKLVTALKKSKRNDLAKPQKEDEVKEES